MPKEVQVAMDRANETYCNMWELLQKGGEVIAKGTGAEAAWITSGGFAALVLGAAACMGCTRERGLRPHPVGWQHRAQGGAGGDG